MNQYSGDINDYLENNACEILDDCLNGLYVIKRNNLTANTIDLKVCDNNEKILCTIDVQYSMNFAKYRDVRIDLMSAGIFKTENSKPIWQLNRDISNASNSLEKFKSLFDIQKYGKYFQPDAKDMLGIFYYFYNGEFQKNVRNFQSYPTDFYFFLPKRIVLKEIKENPNLIIKINDKHKNGIFESHHSAFACFNIKDLVEKYDLPRFYNKQDLCDNFSFLLENELKEYLIR